LPFKANADRRHRIPKPRFRATNWAEYDAALRGRGSLTVWFTDAAIAAWKAEPRTTRDGQPRYSELAITTALTLRTVFRLALRQTDGLIGSIMALLGLDLSVPDHSTLSRRAEKQGSRARRSWRKLHIGVYADPGRILAAELTAHDVDDASQVGPLLDQVSDPIASFTADSAYDQDGVYREVAARHPDAAVVVPPPPAPCRAPRPRRSQPGATSTFRPSRKAAAWRGRRRLATTGVPSSRQISRASSA